MNVNDLQKLHRAVEVLTRQKVFLETIEQLKEKLHHSPEPFVWSVIDLNSVGCELPETIRSGWIFVLKKDIWSGCHYHPNSIQHMVMLEGQGRSKIADISRRMVLFAPADSSPEDSWCVIGKGVPHEFFPEERDMVVVSFHTCEASELEEVACGTGEKRFYEGVA